MFETVTIPVKLNKSPLLQTVFEIRYSGPFPPEALYGLLFPTIQRHSAQLHETGIQQLPAEIRNVDPNLIYQPYIFSDIGKYRFAIGPKSITFTCLREYDGWDNWKAFIDSFIYDIFTLGIINQVERIGVRYIDGFTDLILSNINASLQIASSTVQNAHTSIRTEILDGDSLVLLHIANGVYPEHAGLVNKEGIQAIIDIDCIINLGIPCESFKTDYQSLLGKAHLINKRYFFGIIKESYLPTFEPIYSEGDR